MICIMKACVPRYCPIDVLLLIFHSGEGHFDDGSNKPSGAATPIDADPVGKGKKGPGKGKGLSKKAKTAKQRLAIADAEGDLGMGGM